MTNEIQYIKINGEKYKLSIDETEAGLALGSGIISTNATQQIAINGAKDSENTSVTHSCGIAIGSNAQAQNYGAVAIGGSTVEKNLSQVTAQGKYSFATGQNNNAIGLATFVAGADNTVKSNYASAFGRNNKPMSTQTVVGRFNTPKEVLNDKQNPTDGHPFLIVGDGTGESNRRNAFWAGIGGQAYARESWLTGTTADYAEYFEWADQNPNNEDRTGYVVSLQEDKIVFANEDDFILGVISANPAVLADTAEDFWQGKYLTDEFGRLIYETIIDPIEGEIEQPKLNPLYDAEQEYAPRRVRPEWSAVGMMGKLYIRDNGTCVPGRYAKPVNGVLTYSTEPTHIYIMKRIKEDIVYALVK